jgi:hypothetical protein
VCGISRTLQNKTRKDTMLKSDSSTSTYEWFENLATNRVDGRMAETVEIKFLDIFLGIPLRIK